MNIALLKNTLELVHAGQIIDFNLADTKIDGKRLFNMGDIPRLEMPQLKGFARPGSVADMLDQDHNNKVNVMDEFLNYVSNVMNIAIDERTEPARSLRGSQRELVASKVAKHALKMLGNSSHKKFSAVYVTSDDGTLLDGHHGWAAVRCYEALTSSGVSLNTLRVSCDIAGLIKMARQFTLMIGVENKEGV